MLRKRNLILFFVLAGWLCIWLLGCTWSGRNRREAGALDQLKSQVYLGDARVAERAALALLSSQSDAAYRILKEAISRSESDATRNAVMLAFIVQRDPRIRGEVIEALGYINPRTVELAKEYLLAVIGDDAAMEVLGRARDASRRDAERLAAIEVLGNYGAAETVEGLIGILLDESNQDIAEAAAEALRQITYQPFGTGGETWREWYRQNRRLPRQAWRTAGEHYYRELEGLKGTISTLEGQLSDTDSEVVLLARSLVDLGVEFNRPQLAVSVLSGVRPIEAQIYAAQKLGLLKARVAVDVLMEKVQSSDPRMAEAAIRALGEIGDPQATSVLASRLQDGTNSVKLEAVKAYARLPESNLSRLMPLIRDPSAEVRAAVARALGARPWKEATGVLLDALGDQVADVRAASAEALGSIQDTRAVGQLVKVVEDGDDTVAFYAVRSLSSLADPSKLDESLYESVYDAFVRGTRHSSPGVREASVVALEKLGDKRAVDRLFEISFADTTPRVADKAWGSLLVLVGADAQVVFALADRIPVNERFDRYEVLMKSMADAKNGAESVREARLRLAGSYLERENYQGARNYFQKALESKGDDQEAFAGLASALEGLGDYKALAMMYASRITAGGGLEEDGAAFVGALEGLFALEDYASVVASAQRVMESAAVGAQLAGELRGLYGKALGPYKAGLVESLGAEDAAKREAASKALAAYGREAAGALVGGLESASQEVRTAAFGMLAALAQGDTFGYDPSADEVGRAQAVERWKTWLKGQSGSENTSPSS